MAGNEWEQLGMMGNECSAVVKVKLMSALSEEWTSAMGEEREC